MKNLVANITTFIPWFTKLTGQQLIDFCNGNNNNNNNAVSYVLIQKILASLDILESAVNSLEARLDKLENPTKKKESKDKNEESKTLQSY